MSFTKSFCFSLLVASFCLALPNSLLADDPGITKVRLIQRADTAYVFEADVPQLILSDLKEPVFPERFKQSDLSYANQSGWITIRLIYTTSGLPLSPADEILLPWNRNGVDMTAQWLDGTTFKALFNRTLGGIRIPLSELMTVERTTWSILEEGFLSGVALFPFKGVHIFLVLLLVLLYPSSKSLGCLLWFSGGHYLAMVIGEFGITGWDLLLSELYIVLVCLLLSIHLTYRKEITYIGILMLVMGLAHGLSYINEIDGHELNNIQQVQSLFGFNLAIDLGHYLVAMIAILMLRKKAVGAKWIGPVSGSVAIFLVLLIFNENVLMGNLKILERESTSAAPMLRPPQGNQPGRQTQRGTGLMTTPVVTYLSVEPYEVRQEILVQGPAALEILGGGKNIASQIPVEVQESLKSELRDSVAANTRIVIDGETREPSEIQAHFVTLNRGGVSSRQNPMAEDTRRAIIGLTLIYDIQSYPDSITVDWKLFPPSSPEIEASAVDPHGALTTMITSSSNQVRWKNRLAGYKVPGISIIEIQRPLIPLVSILLLLLVMAFISYLLLQRQLVIKRNRLILVSIVTALGFGCYPFLRTDLKLPLLSEGTPDQESTSEIIEDLLTNVYLAFDRRGEEQVYDRLALTVLGDQLTEIYLQNRQSMAMESRGGARAKVDEVSIQELYEVKRAEGGGFVADALWTVRGSVNHFGHTHYRQNQYRALVSFIDVDDTWKIRDIVTLDERRLY